MPTQLDPLSLSADLLYTVTTEGDTDWLQDRLATLERARLRRALASREGKLAFWLNCYNAYVQLLSEDDPSVLDGGIRDRWRFRTRDRIPVSGVRMSLNDIEHGMLRSSKHPLGRGYVPRLFPSSFERRFRLDDCEPRIHFAVSHGGDHCPPVTVYSPADVDTELNIAVEWFLEENVTYDPDGNVATVPRLFRRYRGDFGGKRGIVAFLRKHDAIPDGRTPSLRYESMSRTPAVEFVREP
ncbi:DUF547 domain-containing protein [Natronorubrum sulfidifaciens]|uniref:DUF547 domain-containing protein n=1 Tax=Natronorubrum sulfidifaciens JCM 14089 TaxID=1230460 RepID=L9WDV1_9EURY|nr:DUF547 domain-containing protein [Natronorubrum sulfidifaciens]ELY47644.1 hypothetical protein C495_05282 [Natronorubrum sulfidifaciens JCM 14089]